MKDTVLEIQDLSVNLSNRQILKGVNLQCQQGELLGLLGPNGAGKTTLLRTMMGLIPAAAGQISVLGKTGNKAADLIGYVPQRQDVAWDFPINVGGLVMQGLTRQLGWLRTPGTKHWKAVYRALERVKMREFAERPIQELSGGQRQRILIARALVTDPALLVLDEPFTGLDMPTQELLTVLFGELTNGGTSLLMTTHDLNHALVTCDRVALLRGTVIAEGTPSQLTDPQPWMETFEVSAQSPLIKQLGMVLC
ncbi:anchored repeat-type ABC transporter ATP-binding subunit [Boudabousia liubingyangii]|uniref:Anchored repeat-type ABC transporter ATP-binding subunit n=1 Tax=Boudabousia liubingyangii TaxID=1921764 RepID=A0A1Q5PK80_9ACTO|nr:anchored repeat-type ABC transporter ATP-binding subunit [Boudabousia liubingyangii]OKL46617.1 anchored repeat-type ABC transporter ATP-binding subunit [Boudabousia liubingyangii]OKL46794.1 anchored repeat-type ABC transporter ATP-binding subunit [Boudabousia liubingyangii]